MLVKVVRILGNIRQYRLLTGLYDRAIRLSRDNRFFWHQLSLSLICDHRFSRASKVLKNCITQAEAGTAETRISDESILLEYMQLARIQIEQMDDIDLGNLISKPRPYPVCQRRGAAPGLYINKVLKNELSQYGDSYSYPLFKLRQ